MQSDINPQQWREQLNSRLNEAATEQHLYLILSGTSEGEILRNYYDQGGTDAQPLWLNTPYSEWQEVMPYLVEITADHAFLTWLDEHQAEYPDWGVALLSEFPMDVVFTHFESLTKISLSSGKEVFFRYWDAPQSQPVLTLCDAQGRAELMGPVSNWLSSQGGIEHPDEPRVIGKSFPWWVLSEALATALFEQNPEILKQNLKQRLIDAHYDSIDGMSESQLDVRLGAFIQNNPDGNVKELLKYLSRWQR